MGMDNREIAKTVKMAYRTVKAHLNRMFMKARIRDGLPRVKLAVLLYRQFNAEEKEVPVEEQRCSEISSSSATEWQQP
jgi:hypothetical protein